MKHRIFLVSGLLLLVGCATAAHQYSGYPEHWWKPVPLEGKPVWEVLPQEAGPGEVILSKRNELGILSNFAPTPFEFRGKHYASLEGFWQMMLYPEGPKDPRQLEAKKAGLTWKHSRDQVSKMVAFEAKKAGQEADEILKKIGIDWVSFEGQHFPYRSATPGKHFELIRGAMRAKLDQNPKVREVLLSTGNLILKPDHHSEVGAPPEWAYFDIWMEYRKDLQIQQK